MFDKQKASLPRSAGSRSTRIRTYCHTPRSSLRMGHSAPVRPPCQMPGPCEYRKILQFITRLAGSWLEEAVDLPHLATHLLLRENRGKKQRIIWKPLVVVVVCVLAATGGVSLLTMQPHVAVQKRRPEKALLPTGAAERARYRQQNPDKNRYGVAAVMLSPNSEDRPPATQITAIVLHATGTSTGQEAINTFLNPDSKRSSHFLIDRNGAVIEVVPPERRAFHAGRSTLGGVSDLNNFSVGIELVGRNDGQPYSQAQYAATSDLIGRLRMHYSIPDGRIVSHAAVALPPGRKTDPVGFDFDRLYRLLRP